MRSLLLASISLLVLSCLQVNAAPTSKHLNCISIATVVILFDKDGVIKTYESTGKSLNYWTSMRGEFAKIIMYRSKKEGRTLKQSELEIVKAVEAGNAIFRKSYMKPDDPAVDPKDFHAGTKSCINLYDI